VITFVIRERRKPVLERLRWPAQQDLFDFRPQVFGLFVIPAQGLAKTSNKLVTDNRNAHFHALEPVFGTPLPKLLQGADHGIVLYLVVV
jgi:hypothetical protein